MYFSSDLVNAWMIGLTISAIIGPIGLMCIQQTLHSGFSAGIAVGFGAALADGLYALIAGAGITVISHFLLQYSSWIHILGGMFLIFLALKELFTSQHFDQNIPIKSKNLIKLGVQTFFLTLSNPITIMSFMSIFATLGNTDLNLQRSLWMTLGIFLGSITWWIILSSLVTYVRKKVSEKHIGYLRYLSALILGCFGLWAIFY